MTAITDLAKVMNPADFLKQAVGATSTDLMQALLTKLPIVPEDDKSFDPTKPESGWNDGRLHWIPVGRDRGNAGRIKLANQPVNPMAERIINGMEALIELERAREMVASPEKPAPTSPRNAALRYFKLPPLDKIPLIKDAKEYDHVWGAARDLSRKLRVRLLPSKKIKGKFQFAVFIEDEGIGQSPTHIHDRLLSLGSSDKGDKPYLIGLFGQGGSSAFAVSEYSWVLSRRAPDLLGNDDPGIGWSVVKQIFPQGRRDPFFAYLAAHPDGRVARFPAAAADVIGFKHGTWFGHIGYDFSRGGSAVARMLFQALNHVLYNPILPYELYAAREFGDIMWGHAYRLSRLSRKGVVERPPLDKRFNAQTVYK